MIAKLSLLLVLALPACVAAQTLPQQLQSLAPGQWLSYEVPLQSGLRAPCCFDWKQGDVRRAGCSLERDNRNFGHSDDDPPPPPGAALRVLLRRGDRDFDRVLAVGTQCAVDPGNAIVRDAGAVEPDASIALLSPGLEQRPRKSRHHLLSAVAHHASPRADVVLQDASAPGRGDDLRRDAVFWLAQARGVLGFRHVRDLIERETDDDLLRHEVFALSISDVPEAVSELRRLALGHSAEKVRAEAIFWLAQEEDAQTEAIARQMLEREPSRHLRDKAVFALSQLPPKRAIPALRQLIESPGPRDVRKQAIFWLAQVDDEAVLPVFDQLLGDGR